MKRFGLKAKLALASGLFAVLAGVGLAQATPVRAAATNPTPEAKVSFTFDDGGASNITKVAPILAQYGYTGTSYITTSCVGMTTIPNKCPADTDIPYMTWAQIKSLQNSYGWEIGSHSVTHPLMTEITATKLEQEVANSKSALKAQGINATSFATPYGDYNSKVQAAIAKYYSNHRPFHDTGFNVWPYDNYLLRVQQVQYGVSVDTVKGYIDQAKANNTWLILVFHDVRETASTDPEDYQYSTADLTAIAAYAKSKSIKNTNVSSALVTSPASDNLVTDTTTGNSLGTGWSTDAPTSVKVNTASNGNGTDAKTSIQIKATTKNVHLFTPTVAVSSTNKYVIKGYVNMTAQASGDIGFYIDEYDVNGNWISGQYLQTINAWYVKDLSLIYSASSAQVAKARLQIIVTANSGITVYIDSVQWFVTTSGPAPTPVPVVNLLTNGSFEAGMTGWSTDKPTAIVADSTNNGAPASSPQASLKFTAPTTGTNAHLFSNKVQVSSSKTYTISGYLKVLTLTSKEVAFYIDEYDVNGNWISGQYLYAQRAVGTGSFSFSYKPTSANVASASLQFIVESGSGISGYIDNLSWSTV